MSISPPAPTRPSSATDVGSSAGDAGPVAPPTTIVVGDLVVDRGAGVASLDGRAVPLRRREFELLAYLAERSGRFVSRQELMRQVWHDPILASGNTLHVHLSSLRRKLGERPDAPRYVHTRRNQGICVAAPEELPSP